MKLKNPIRPYFYGLVFTWTALVLFLISFIVAFGNSDWQEVGKHHATIDAHLFVLIILWMLGLLGLFWGYYAMMVSIRKRQELENELIQSHKLESLKLLAGGIAHNFNNLLQIIKMGTDLTNRKELPSSERKAIDSVYTAIGRAESLVNKLLVFRQNDSSDKCRIKLNDLIVELADLMITGTDVKLLLNLASDLLNVFSNEGLLSQLIVELLVNAKEAMPNGGVLDIKTVNCYEIKPAPGMIKGDYVKLTIKDTGLGIIDSNFWRLNDPFFTTKHPGAGLGLTCAHSIVKIHGGKINLVSRKGVGTYFTVYLPAIP